MRNEGDCLQKGDALEEHDFIKKKKRFTILFWTLEGNISPENLQSLDQSAVN